MQATNTIVPPKTTSSNLNSRLTVALFLLVLPEFNASFCSFPSFYRFLDLLCPSWVGVPPQQLQPCVTLASRVILVSNVPPHRQPLCRLTSLTLPHTPLAVSTQIMQSYPGCLVIYLRIPLCTTCLTFPVFSSSTLALSTACLSTTRFTTTLAHSAIHSPHILLVRPFRHSPQPTCTHHQTRQPLTLGHARYPPAARTCPNTTFCPSVPDKPAPMPADGSSIPCIHPPPPWPSFIHVHCTRLASCSFQPRAPCMKSASPLHAL